MSQELRSKGSMIASLSDAKEVLHWKVWWGVYWLMGRLLAGGAFMVGGPQPQKWITGSSNNIPTDSLTHSLTHSPSCHTS